MTERSEPTVMDLDNWQRLKSTLPVGWMEIATRNGLGTPAQEPHNASGVGPEAKLRTLLTMVAWNLSLRAVSGLFAGAGLHDVSHVGIHGWLKRSVPTFEELLQAMVSANQAFAPERWAGYVVRAIDATTAQRPGAIGTTARIHLVLRLSDMHVDQVKVTNCRTGETFRNFKTCPGTLDIGDRGYSNPPSIAAAVEQGGDVLVRWNFASLPLHKGDNGEKVDVRRITKDLLPGQRRELCVEVRHRNAPPIPGRLLLERLPDDEAAKARERVRDEGGGRLAQQMASFVMLFTTVPEARLTAALLFRLYRMRWQVELRFKRDKSIAGLDMLPNFRDDTIRAWLLAKLVLCQMVRRLLDSSPAAGTEDGPRPGPSLPVSMPWQSTVTGWVLLRCGLVTIRLEHAALFLERLGIQFARLKTEGRKARRQIADFLAALAPTAAALHA